MAIYNTPITATSVGSAQTISSGTGKRAITTVIVCNHTAVDKTLTLYAVGDATGFAAGDDTTIVKLLTVPAYDTVSFDQEKLVLDADDELQAICSAAGLTATVSTLPV
jgi:hypothetical protein